MVDVSIYEAGEGEYTGFSMSGHAGYAEYGQDIVCAAVSVLAINTVNSIERLTEDVFENTADPGTGRMDFFIKGHPVSASAQLLLKSLVLGLKGIEAEYGEKHIKLHFKKDQEV